MSTLNEQYAKQITWISCKKKKNTEQKEQSLSTETPQMNSPSDHAESRGYLPHSMSAMFVHLTYPSAHSPCPHLLTTGYSSVAHGGRLAAMMDSSVIGPVSALPLPCMCSSDASRSRKKIACVVRMVAAPHNDRRRIVIHCLLCYHVPPHPRVVYHPGPSLLLS